MKKKSDKDMSTDQKASIFAQSKKRAEQLAKSKGNNSYLQSLKSELAKVSWTSKGDLIQCTKIVVGSTFAFGIGIYVADLFVRGFLKGLSSIVKFIGG